jgi:hypothetical protein
MMHIAISNSSTMHRFPPPLLSTDVVATTSSRSKTCRHWDMYDPQTTSPNLQNKSLKRVAAILPVRSSQSSAPASSGIPIPSSSDTYQHDYHVQQQQQQQQQDYQNWRHSPSEHHRQQQLLHDQQQLAEYRDDMFFHRVVNGIRQTQRKSQVAASSLLYYQNERCLSHVIQIRQLEDPQADLVSDYTNDDDDSTLDLQENQNLDDDDDDDDNDDDNNDNDDGVFHMEL